MVVYGVGPPSRGRADADFGLELYAVAALWGVCQGGAGRDVAGLHATGAAAAILDRRDTRERRI